MSGQTGNIETVDDVDNAVFWLKRIMYNMLELYGRSQFYKPSIFDGKRFIVFD